MHEESRAGRLLIVILTLGVFGIINTEMGVVGMVPQIADHFQVSIPAAGWTVSIFALCVACAAPVMPLLCSRFNRRRLMLITLALFTACPMVSALTQNFAAVLIARALPALLHPVYVSLAFTAAAAAVPPEYSSRAVARVFVGVSAGMVLGVPLTSFIAVHVSYEAAMLSFAAVNGLVLLLTLKCVPSMPGAKRSFGEQLAVLHRPLLWHAVIGFTLINGAMFGFFSFMSAFLNEVSGLTFDAAGAVLLGYGIANILGNMLGGRLFAGHRAFYLMFLPCLMLTLYAALYGAGQLSTAAAGLILSLGLCAGFINIAGQYMIVSSAPEAPDFANGLFLCAANAGTMSGTALCGFFISAGGLKQALWGTFIYLSLSLIFVALRLKGSRRIS